jgi:hypothetical protein
VKTRRPDGGRLGNPRDLFAMLIARVSSADAATAAPRPAWRAEDRARRSAFERRHRQYATR